MFWYMVVTRNGLLIGTVAGIVVCVTSVVPPVCSLDVPVTKDPNSHKLPVLVLELCNNLVPVPLTTEPIRSSEVRSTNLFATAMGQWNKTTKTGSEEASESEVATQCFLVRPSSASLSPRGQLSAPQCDL